MNAVPGGIINESVLSETSFTQISLLEGFNTRSPSPPLQQQDGDAHDDSNSIENILHTSFPEKAWVTGSPMPLEYSEQSQQQQQQQNQSSQQQQQHHRSTSFSFTAPSPHFIEGDKDSPTPFFNHKFEAPFDLMSNFNEARDEQQINKNGQGALIDPSSMTTPIVKPASTTGETFASTMNRRSTTLTLKDQEKVILTYLDFNNDSHRFSTQTIDTLKKDNFGLKMKIYYLEKRLDELSPDQNDLAIRENIDLKVNIQTLGQELKKYKNMILELNQAMAILQQQPCPKPHGMSKEEQMDYDDALTSADAYRLENDQLQKLVSEQRMENARLRLFCSQRLGVNHGNTETIANGNSSGNQSTVINTPYMSTAPSMSHPQQQLQLLSLSPSSSSSSTSPSKDKEILERYKKSWAQSKHTIHEQNETIRGLQDTIQQYHAKMPTSLGSSDKGLGEDWKANYQWHELEQTLTHTRERNRDLLSQLQTKSDELERAWAEKEELTRIVENTRQDLQDKCIEYDEIVLQVDHNNSDRSNRRGDEMEKKKLRHQYDHMEQSYRTLKMDYSDMEEQKYDEQRKCQRLQKLLDQREHDMELLEDEIVKLVSHAESLEKQLQESNHELGQKEEEYTTRIQEENNTKLQSYLQQQQQQQENTIVDLEKRFSILMATELEQKEAHYQHLESNMAEAHARAQDDAKQRYEDDLQLLEIKFNQVEQSIRERDVRIASLEGHLEAQTDATDREKQIRQEEIKELEEQLQDALSTIQQQQHTLGQFQQHISVSHSFEPSDEMNLAKQVWRLCHTFCALLNLLLFFFSFKEELEKRIHSLQNHLQEADDRLKRDRQAANQALNDYMKSQHLLQQKLEAVRKRNDILTSLLDQCQNPEVRHKIAWTASTLISVGIDGCLL